MKFLNMYIDSDDINDLKRQLTPYNVQTTLFDLAHLPNEIYHIGFSSKDIWLNTINQILSDRFNIEPADQAHDFGSLDITDKTRKTGDQLLRDDPRFAFYVPFKSFCLDHTFKPINRKQALEVLDYVGDHTDDISTIDIAKYTIMGYYDDLINKSKRIKRSNQAMSKIVTQAQYLINDCYSADDEYPLPRLERQWMSKFEDLVDEHDIVSKPKALKDLHDWMNPASGLMEESSSDYTLAYKDVPRKFNQLMTSHCYWFKKNDNSFDGDYRPTVLLSWNGKDNVLDLLYDMKDVILGDF